jgi:hypothetical protein
VPVLVTAIVLFPFLLYIVFADPHLIPISIEMHELSEQEKAKKPVNPNIPHARGNAEEEEKLANTEQGQLLSLEEIMNPFVDRGGAAFGAVIMTVTLVTLLVLNAVSASSHEHPVFWVTLPAAFVMFCWDLVFGWIHRHETREIARKGREEVELARAERALREEEVSRGALFPEERGVIAADDPQTQSSDDQPSAVGEGNHNPNGNDEITAPSSVSTPRLESSVSALVPRDQVQNGQPLTSAEEALNEKQELPNADYTPQGSNPKSSTEKDENKRTFCEDNACEVPRRPERGTLVSFLAGRYRWCQETFPTTTAVVAHLPFALVPFAFSMFVLVQALVTKGWVAVFAYGWDHWVNQTGTVGSIGGMGFLSVILCNVSISIWTVSHVITNPVTSLPAQTSAPPSSSPE